jgi:hypothetical protein
MMAYGTGEQMKSLEDQILEQVLVIQALRLRIARMESIYTTPRSVKSTGQNGTTEDTRHQRDTIEEYGPMTPRCVTDQEVEQAEDDGA